LLKNRESDNKNIEDKNGNDDSNSPNSKNSFKSSNGQSDMLKLDAVVCYNDEIALKVIQAIKDHGLNVPQDISVIGYDDSSLATVSDIKLTTVKHPKKQMGKQAAHHLIEMLENNCLNHKVICEPELVIRSSCKIIK